MLLWLAVVFVPVKNVDGAGLLPLCMLFSLSIFAFFTFFLYLIIIVSMMFASSI